MDCLHNLSEAGNFFHESHGKEMSQFNSLIQVVSCAEILCWSFLERINYFSFDCRSAAGLLMISDIIRPNGQQ